MKSVYIFLVVSISCIYFSYCKDLIVGTSFDNRVAGQQKAEYNSIHFKKRVKEVLYSDSGQQIIERLREHTKKLARVVREEARPKQSSQNNTITFIQGDCKVNLCEKEAACVPAYNATLHYCVCASNGEPAKEGVKCPRTTVPISYHWHHTHNAIPLRPSSRMNPRYPATPSTA